MSKENKRYRSILKSRHMVLTAKLHCVQESETQFTRIMLKLQRMCMILDSIYEEEARLRYWCEHRADLQQELRDVARLKQIARMSPELTRSQCEALLKWEKEK